MEFHDEDKFLPTLSHIFSVANWFGIPSYGNKISTLWAFVVIMMLIAIEGVAVWKIIRVVAGLAVLTDDGRGLTARLSGAIFYANGLFSLILSWRFVASWKNISFYWGRADSADGLDTPVDNKSHRRMIVVICFITICAVLEHCLSMISAIGLDSPPLEYFKRYILGSHAFLSLPEQYSLWTAIPIFFLSKIATILWNFQDLIIILISMGLTSRYHKLNSYVNFIVNYEKPARDRNKDFLETITNILKWSQIIGIVNRGSRYGMAWGLLVLLTLLVIEFEAIWKVIKALAGWAVDTVAQRSVTARLSGTMFYSSAIASQILCSRFSLSWGTLSSFWVSVERAMAINVPPDTKLKKRMVTVLVVMTSCAAIEHVMSVISLVGFDCPPERIIRRYTLRSHGFLLLRDEYSIFFAIPLLCFSNIATVLWNFQDALVVLICMGLTSRYCRLNQYVAKICREERKMAKGQMKAEAVRVYTWRKIREAYVKQASLVRRVDRSIGSIILLTSFGNFYFICLQLFLGITQGLLRAELIKLLYYLVSLMWLVIRFSWMVLAAAEVYVQSRNALQYIHTCHSKCYNIEIERLQNQLNKDNIVLSGFGFFSIDRNILLQMATAVVTYELVLIQFDDKGTDNIPTNGTNTKI